MWLFVQGKSQFADDICIVTFACLNIFWGTIFLESWKRKQAEYAYKWGTLGMDEDLLQEPRPGFVGELVRSPVTGRMEMFYPHWKRRLIRYGLSYPATAACILTMFFVMLAIFRWQEWCDR